jgi:hypothetical protein
LAIPALPLLGYEYRRTRRASSETLAGAEGFEPPSPVLETGSLAVELTPLFLIAELQNRRIAELKFGNSAVRQFRNSLCHFTSL